MTKLQLVETPLAQAQSTLRANLAELIEQRDKTKHTLDESLAALTSARSHKRETKYRLETAQRLLAEAMEFYRPQNSDAAPAYVMPSMGGQSWDFRNRTDLENPKPEAQIPTSSLRELLDAESKATDDDFEAGRHVGMLEAVQSEAERVIAKAEKAITAAVNEMCRPELMQELKKAQLAQAKLIEHIAVIKFLADKLENPYGASTPDVIEAIRFLRILNLAEWDYHPADAQWRQAYERLRSDPNTPLPE